MGTTSEKLTYLNVTKQKLKQAINNIGGEVTDETTFREYAEELQDIYDNLPKTEYQEGTEVNLGVTSKGKLDFDDGKVGFGQASQESTQGYNLLNLKDYTETINGVTITIRNGVITLNGTSTNYTTRLISQEPTSQLNGDYNLNYEYVSGSVNGTSNINLYDGTTELAALYVNTTSRNQNISFSNKVVSTRLYYHNNAVFNNFTIKPMLYSGNYDSSKTYEKYTGGQASPNPSYPQEIKCVRGWNILNQDKLEYGTISQSDGTTISPSGDVLYLDDYIPIKPSSYYTFRSNRANYLVRLFYYDRNKNYISTETKSGTFQTISTAYYLRVQCGASVNDEFQLVEGNVNLPYLPYNTIEEVVSGKNKLKNNATTSSTGGFDFTVYDDGTVKVNGTHTSTVFFTLTTNQKIAPNTTYTLSGAYSPSARLRIREYDINDTNLSEYFDSGSGVTFTSKSNVDHVNVQIVLYASQTNIMFYPQLEQGNQATPYEPYITPTSYQLSLGDIELNAIGDYKDELVYDVDEDKVYKNEKIGKYTFTGNENIALATSVGNMYAFRYDDLSNNYIGRDENQYLCTNYKQKLVADWDNEGIINVSTSVPYIYIFTTGDTASNVTTFKTWLANNKPLLYYRLETPTQTEITDTTLINQVKALYNTHSNNGTTIITSNGNLPMIIKCRGLKGE